MIEEKVNVDANAGAEDAQSEKIDLSKENENLKELLQRKVAEFENYKARSDKEKAILLEFGNERLIARFIDVLDDLEKADKSAKENPEPKTIAEGLTLIRQNAEKIFTEVGVSMMEVNIGDEFDVNKHEALMTQPSENIPEGHITLVIQNGYLYKDKVIRYAKVATSSGN